MARDGRRRMDGWWIIGIVVLYLVLNWLVLPKMGVKT